MDKRRSREFPQTKISHFAGGGVPFKTKLHGLFHLFNSSVFLMVLLVSLLSVPTLLVMQANPEYKNLYKISSIFLVSTMLLMVFYWVSYQSNRSTLFSRLGSFVGKFFLFLCFSMGLSLHNSVAVIEGISGKKSSFVRTPKFNITSNKDGWTKYKYIEKNISLITVLEGFLSLYFLAGICIDLVLCGYGMLPLHVMLFTGFGALFSYSVYHSTR